MNKIEFTRFAELDYTGDEALNTLCTNLTFAGAGIRRIMMTSCHASEGQELYLHEHAAHLLPAWASASCSWTPTCAAA